MHVAESGLFWLYEKHVSWMPPSTSVCTRCAIPRRWTVGNNLFAQKLMRKQRRDLSAARLENGSRVAVIGGGPAGSFFSYFLLDMAERIGLKIQVDIYEPRDFDIPGPTGCNMCGGVLYESLVQSLAVEGINLPETVVRRGVEHNMLHLI
jgi:hypothetical protein